MRPIVYLSLILGLFPPLGLQAQQDSFLVKPYLQFGTQTSMTVLWETTALASSVVSYGEAQVRATEPNLSQQKRLEGNRLLHELVLDSLKPETKYLYRVSSTTASGQLIQSEVSTFRTAVKDESAYHFAFIGDTQRNNKTPWAWSKIAERIWGERPHFIVNAGDLVDVGFKKSDWVDHFFPDGQVAMSRYAMYTVLGNHEQDAQLYYDYMANPAPEYYYTFRYGNAQFFMIDTNREIDENSEQYNWLEWQLAQSDATWKFVVHHHPPYSTEENDHGDTYIGASTYRTHARDLTPLYDTYGVDFCLFGHTHVYERTWPLFQEQISMDKGVVYINSGGAGGGLENFDPTRSWFTLEMERTHHYCTFAIYDNTLIFKAIDHEGRLFDTFQLKKDKDNRSSLLQAPAPRIEFEEEVFETQTEVSLQAIDTGYQIFYTLEGSTPDENSLKYEAPISLSKTALLKALAVSPEGAKSRVVEHAFTRMEPLLPIKTAKTEPGLSYRYYEGSWDSIPDFRDLTPLRSGVVSELNTQAFEHRKEHYGVVFEGLWEVPAKGAYTLYTRTDDGSMVYIDDQLVVDNNGDHSVRTRKGTVILAPGKHRIRIEYFQGGGGQALQAGLIMKEMGRVPFRMERMSH